MLPSPSPRHQEDGVPIGFNADAGLRGCCGHFRLYTPLPIFLEPVDEIVPNLHGHIIEMDDLRFYMFFNSVSVISGGWAVDNEKLCEMELHLWLRSICHERGSNLAC